MKQKQKTSKWERTPGLKYPNPKQKTTIVKRSVPRNNCCRDLDCTQKLPNEKHRTDQEEEADPNDTKRLRQKRISIRENFKSGSVRSSYTERHAGMKKEPDGMSIKDLIRLFNQQFPRYMLLTPTAKNASGLDKQTE